MEELIRDDARIEITLNGRPRKIGAGWSVSDLVSSLELQDRLVVVERNGVIIPRNDFPSVEVVAGDTLEIVHFVGGG
jgi:thiamine biosynthesis protein ThiS